MVHTGFFPCLFYVSVPLQGYAEEEWLSQDYPTSFMNHQIFEPGLPSPSQAF